MGDVSPGQFMERLRVKIKSNRSHWVCLTRKGLHTVYCGSFVDSGFYGENEIRNRRTG